MITSSTLSAGKNKCQETTKQEFEKSSLGTPSVITMITIEGASLFTESRSGRYPANNSRSFWPVGVVPTFKKSRSMYSCQFTLRGDRVKDVLNALTILYCVRVRLPLPWLLDPQLTLMLTSNVGLFRKHKSIP